MGGPPARAWARRADPVASKTLDLEGEGRGTSRERPWLQGRLELLTIERKCLQ